MERRILGEAGIAYSVAALLPVLFSLVLQLILPAAAGDGYTGEDWYKYLSYLVSPVCIAAAAFVFFRSSKLSPRGIYCGCKLKYFAVALLLEFGLLFSLSELNEYFVRFLELFGYRRAESTLPSLDGWNLLPALIVIAILPAFFEETLFRGVITQGMARGGWGTYAAVCVSGALFSLFHTNPEQTLYQFFCGAGFALVALRAGSLFPSALAHFVNNAVILVLASCGYTSFTQFSSPVYIALVTVSALCLAGALLFLTVCDRKKNVKGGAKGGKTFFLAAAVGIAVCAAEWIIVLVERIV